jgi:diguanylate cyclase (GGDEF)-like protein/PAS domain S-box-containing protein
MQPHAIDPGRVDAEPATESVLLAVLEGVRDGIVALRADATILAWNAGMERLSGIPRERALGRSLAVVAPELQAALPTDAAPDRGGAGSPCCRETALFGHTLLCTVKHLPQAGMSGWSMLCVIRDEARLERLERELAGSERRFLDFVEAASDWFWEMDDQLRYSYLSERYFDATGLRPECRLGRRRGDSRLSGPDDGDWEAHLADLAAHRPFRDFTFAFHDTDQKRRVAQVSGRPVFGPDGSFQGYRGVGRDITEQVRAEAHIRHMARHDALTDLPNRVVFRDRMIQAIAAARRHDQSMALLSVDLDDFKSINDTLGHGAGDEFLCHVAACLREAVRETDTVARLGGDEFAIIQTDLAQAGGAAVLAERVVERLAQPIRIQGHVIHGSCSVGISIFPADGDTPDALLRSADLALYRAKASGRNTFQFYERAMGDELQLRRQLEHELREAIEQETLGIEYQPQIDLRSGRFVGVEALIRWRSAELGQVPPALFVPIAEHAGLILDLGRWVLRGACTQAKAWRDAGLNCGRVAVNLSASQFARHDLVDDILQVLSETGLPPTCLELEITEGVLMADTEEAISTLRRLSELGVALTMDDFGTGYCSLSYLKRFPLSRIKIDRAFVRDVCLSSEDGAIARAMITLGHNLGLKVLAEGVETAEQLQFLTEHGCDEAQGFFIAPPLAGENCAALLFLRAERDNQRRTGAGNGTLLPYEGASPEQLPLVSGLR